MVGSESEVPPWVGVLLGEKFFNACLAHECLKKNEKNILCLDCCTSFCPHCLSPHRHHRLLQIRRYVYHDVIRLQDAQKLMDCSFVQSYKTNSAKVVFLKQRPMSRPMRSSGNVCVTCDRSLQDPYLFCSISCKVYNSQVTKQTDRGEPFLSKYCKFLPLPYGPKGGAFPELHDGRIMPPPPFPESPVSLGASSGSSASINGGASSCRALVSSATTEFAKKKRSGMSVSRSSYRRRCLPASELAVFMSRRKGLPHRSPLH
ncbi:protein RGF1 INDUCIBLE TRANSCRIPTION FACTOR 1-like [Malania oleifera]|uniref:protein RGF1 INDUCIBLE TRANSCRIPTION FACTOR 1-like n=1 Tax=Malania oleifera TaxID=397392 RepID=UPI0025AE59A6|nr:protein RGF1 INDUCIBLE TRANSCRIPTION FACTOR 1-like [Malania oleifera]